MDEVQLAKEIHRSVELCRSCGMAFMIIERPYRFRVYGPGRAWSVTIDLGKYFGHRATPDGAPATQEELDPLPFQTEVATDCGLYTIVARVCRLGVGSVSERGSMPWDDVVDAEVMQTDAASENAYGRAAACRDAERRAREHYGDAVIDAINRSSPYAFITEYGRVGMVDLTA